MLVCSGDFHRGAYFLGGAGDAEKTSERSLKCGELKEKWHASPVLLEIVGEQQCLLSFLTQVLLVLWRLRKAEEEPPSSPYPPGNTHLLYYFVITFVRQAQKEEDEKDYLGALKPPNVKSGCKHWAVVEASSLAWQLAWTYFFSSSSSITSFHGYIFSSLFCTLSSFRLMSLYDVVNH